MLKLLICLFATLAIAVAMLQLRQQRMEMNYQANKLHNLIEDHQAKLWNQQVQIAIYTAPNAISRTVGDHALNMVPVAPLPARKNHNWLDTVTDPDAE